MAYIGFSILVNNRGADAGPNGKTRKLYKIPCHEKFKSFLKLRVNFNMKICIFEIYFGPKNNLFWWNQGQNRYSCLKWWYWTNSFRYLKFITGLLVPSFWGTTWIKIADINWSVDLCTDSIAPFYSSFENTSSTIWTWFSLKGISLVIEMGHMKI